MSSRLCSEKFRRFFSNIEAMGIPVKALSDVVSRELCGIAEDIQLGMMSVEFNSPPMPYNEHGSKVVQQMYLSGDGYGEQNITTKFVTGDNGSVVLTSHPVKGVSWDKEQEDEITFLHKEIFVVLGRARLSDIVRLSVSTDAMTKLPNTAGFIGYGNRMLAMGRLTEYTAMFINLKNFRCINTQITEKHGDDVIRAYAAALHAQLLPEEFVARLGGDNFTLLVKKERTDTILAYLAEALIEVQLDSTTVHFVISSRVGLYDICEGDTMHKVMNYISHAMSSAKRNAALDVVRFTPDLLKKMKLEHALTSMFPAALRDREFIVYYQPKVDLADSNMCGCEALVRWKKDGKIISPAEFIPIFERDGNICALDFYMLDNVCRDIRRWLDQGLEPVTVSVNFSKTHLHDPAIAEEIMEIINRYGIDTKYIEVELTEMSDFNDYDAFKNLVSRMKENGVITSIDDFGTGYSSLNLLTDFMFDVVKLDKSFLDNISRSHSKTDEIVVRNIVRMIRELGMKAIAEGVETVEQAQFLKDIQCTMVQGYLYDKPLPAEEFVTRLAHKHYEEKL